jgi:hypothetical protein
VASRKVLDRTAQEGEYLHRDFHGALCYAIAYLDREYGPRVTRRYLERVAHICYAPLIAQLFAEGLPALEAHWREVFGREGGHFSLGYEGHVLVLRVERCPAIAHLRERDQLYTERYCATTEIVNEAICHAAGYRSSCVVRPGQGQCVQRFWREGEGR